ncbi:MAG TPA: HGGxSTG domain-containing protein, partial [Candidatus Acidoferrales bacterium]|nr:HGGxSTG domain-containing protein [Candidatus Acidoferrales bacterium]
MASEMKEPARKYGVVLAAAPQRCGAKTRAEDAHPCKNYAIEGSTRCKFHGSASPQAKRKARERIAEERAAAVLRTQPAEPVTDAVAALRRLCAEVLRNADAQLEAGQTTGSTTGEWIDRASRLLVELARIDGAYIDRSAVLTWDAGGVADLDLDRQIEEIYGNLIAKPSTVARLNTLYDALDAEA